MRTSFSINVDTFDNEYETLLDSSNHDTTNTSIDDNDGNQDHPLHTSHWKDYMTDFRILFLINGLCILRKIVISRESMLNITRPFNFYPYNLIFLTSHYLSTQTLIAESPGLRFL